MPTTMFMTRQEEMGFGVQIERLALNRSVSVGGMVGVDGQRIRQAGKIWSRKIAEVLFDFLCDITRFSSYEEGWGSHVRGWRREEMG